MRIIIIILLTFNFIETIAQEIKIDTILSEKGRIEGYGKVINGERIGTWVFNSEQEGEYWLWTYLENDMIYSRHFYENNKLGDSFFAKVKDSILVKEGNYILYEDGFKIRTLPYVKGKLSGYSYEYYQSQEVKSRMSYRKDILQGTYVNYYQNGTVKEKGNISKGGKVGLWYEYYSDGSLKSEGNYVVLKIKNKDKSNILSEIAKEFYDSWITPNLLEVKDGCWKHYSEKGEVIKGIKYEKGVVVKTKITEL